MIDLWKSDSDWFRHWFNTDAYHSLYQKRDDREAEKFIEQVSRHPLRAESSGSGSGVRGREACGTFGRIGPPGYGSRFE